MTLLDKATGYSDAVFGEGVSTLEFGKSFLAKYAKWILVIVLVLVAGKAYKGSINI